MITIENDVLSARILEKGAELKALTLKKGSVELVWPGDPATWKASAPNLFPIAGGLRGGKISYQGKDWAIPRHGFARDYEFAVKSARASEVEFELVDTPATRDVYPFAFRLTIAYRLAPGSSTLEQTYKVENPAKEDLLFSVGAHTGFRCPLVPGEAFEDYFLEFEKPETLERGFMKDNLLTVKTSPFLKDKRSFDLKPELFADGAIVLKNTASKKVSLVSRRSGARLEVGYTGFPWLVIWSVPGAAFVCIEPW